MTLNTSIAIGRPHDVKEVFAFCNLLLDAPTSVKTEHEDCDSGHRVGQRQILNKPMQGLCAWLWIYYGADGPMVHQHSKWCDTEVGPAKWDDTGKVMVSQEDIDRHAADIAAEPTSNGWAAIEVTFDTAYGYQGENGESCSDLHARLIRALGQWLDARGLPWKWQNEYSGEWHDRYDGLDEFGDAHKATGVDAWFRDMVLPAIESGRLS